MSSEAREALWVLAPLLFGLALCAVATVFVLAPGRGPPRAEQVERGELSRTESLPAEDGRGASVPRRDEPAGGE